MYCYTCSLENNVIVLKFRVYVTACGVGGGSNGCNYNVDAIAFEFACQTLSMLLLLLVVAAVGDVLLLLLATHRGAHVTCTTYMYICSTYYYISCSV